MTISEIYEKYMVPKNLQEHMLRVGALAEILLENWISKKIDGKAVIQACLFHDIAKPMEFNLNKQAGYGMSAADINKLKVLQKHLKSKYGSSEHHAAVKICEEIGLDKTTVEIIGNFEWTDIPQLLKTGNIESLIPIYCDMRIGPNGILSLYKRIADLNKRVNNNDPDNNYKNGNILEQIIKKKINIDIDSVTDNQLNKRFPNLLK